MTFYIVHWTDLFFTTCLLNDSWLTFHDSDTGVLRKIKKAHLFSILKSLKLKGGFFYGNATCSKLIKKSLFWDDWDNISGSRVPPLIRVPLQNPSCRVLGSTSRVPGSTSEMVPGFRISVSIFKTRFDTRFIIPTFSELISIINRKTLCFWIWPSSLVFSEAS